MLRMIQRDEGDFSQTRLPVLTPATSSPPLNGSLLHVPFQFPDRIHHHLAHAGTRNARFHGSVIGDDTFLTGDN